MARTFAVGDIHGDSGRLAALLERLRARANPGDSLVFLGDYINRGPDTRGVIELLLAERERWPGPLITLAGNHERMLAEALRAKGVGPWDRYVEAYHAAPTLQSYGAEDLSRVRFVAHLPESHRRFLTEELRFWYEDARGIYVHAGIPNEMHPRDCPPDALLWTTYGVYHGFGKPVVFGHAVQPGGVPLNEPNRIGLDTGCGSGGPLTAVLLPEREFILVR
jgi:serine/threonine protein phosphatase 1